MVFGDNFAASNAKLLKGERRSFAEHAPEKDSPALLNAYGLFTDFEVVALPRARLDLTRPGEARTVLTSLRADVVVNCAAYNLVDRASGGSMVLLVVMVCIGAPIVEELVYRGLLQGSFAARINDVPAWLAASALFALGDLPSEDALACWLPDVWLRRRGDARARQALPPPLSLR